MKFMIIFWTLYTLAFCIPFPIFIYLMSDEMALEPRNSLEVSYVYLVFSLAVWLYVVVFFINNLFLKTIKEKNTINAILNSGIPREAKIIDYKLIKYNPKTNINIIQIVLSFQNLRNIMIEHEMFFHDIKPQEKRFETGKTVKVLLNPNPSQQPYFILSGQKTKFNNTSLVIRVVFILFLLVYIPGLYYYFYERESFDFGWRFLTFMHPIIFSGVMFLLTILVYQLLVKRIFFRNSKEERILFTGRNAQAEIISVSQTGLLVNNQPQVMFQVSFKDFKGKDHIAVYKSIINLLDMGSLKRQGTVEVVYDENTPEKIIIPRVLTKDI
ncbi:hypothetical protein M2347_000318 [Chryseobacterium sp. H1D6B]|uniref:hypothetical protein n=1 Tax=Chryseobacterium sp. H1D6B TaxID=2940588 RepID=UPI0015CA6658|nr:hypothetical protein [Chryseobacterium sp. H1D6B]MDH6250591.1 hypothetical protein [Chryseobacterium sp. H1D6B]